MTLYEMVQETHERTHWPEMEILEMVRNAWPGKLDFTPTQAKLLVSHIERQMVAVAVPLTDAQVWGE